MRQPGHSRRQTAGVSWDEGGDTGAGKCHEPIPAGPTRQSGPWPTAPLFNDEGWYRSFYNSKLPTKRFFFFPPARSNFSQTQLFDFSVKEILSPPLSLSSCFHLKK